MTKPYRAYPKEHEIQVSPPHNKLEKSFKKFVAKECEGVAFPEECSRNDLRLRSPKLGEVMVEIKPADAKTVRYAIRTAIGQLLDYRQEQMWTGKLLIVVGTNDMSADDRALALSNGFGLAVEVKGPRFEIHCPREVIAGCSGIRGLGGRHFHGVRSHGSMVASEEMEGHTERQV